MKLTVSAGRSNYDITWSDTFEQLADEVHGLLRGRRGRVFVVTDSNVAQLYAKQIKTIFGEYPLLVVPAGEKSKNLAQVESLCEQLLAAGADRYSLLVALGGGVIGDLTGFTSSVYMRGIDFIQIPTTLLSMVDSSVGGKTGVNLKNGKNMIGAFWQPKAVYISLPFLDTLPENELRSGLAETVKTALIRSKPLYYYISGNVPAILDRDVGVYKILSHESIKIKAAVVKKDEKEISGERAWLNYGHTLGHALEAWLGYRGLTHGECVSIGMIFAALVSKRRGLLEEKKISAIYELFGNLNLPRNLRDLPGRKQPTVEELLDLMNYDKKNRDGTIRMVLLRDIGRCELPTPVERGELESALEEFARL